MGGLSEARYGGEGEIEWIRQGTGTGKLGLFNLIG